MPDYDIQAVGLASPPVAAPVASYRPAVLVRNNGIHPANVTGYLRIYRREPPGDLLETHNLALSNLAAGADGNAQSSGFWTPTQADVGREFLFTAHVDTPSDQDTSNNNLSPVTVIVTSAAPPPPPPIQAHAPQHEDGGADEILVNGLRGKCADPQTPVSHKVSHQAGGADAVNVTGLAGILAQPQPIAAHHTTHENGHGDELNVTDLSGVLYNLQKPQVHANEKHDPNFATAADLASHLATPAPYLATSSAPHTIRGNESAHSVHDLHIPATWMLPSGASFAIRAAGNLSLSDEAALQEVSFTALFNGNIMAVASAELPESTEHALSVLAEFVTLPTNVMTATITLLVRDKSGGNQQVQIVPCVVPQNFDPVLPAHIELKVTFEDSDAATELEIETRYAYARAGQKAVALLTGSLSLTSAPTGAKIFLDLDLGGFHDTGEVTPHAFDDLEPHIIGLYRFKLELDDYEDYEDTFAIVANQTTAIHAEMLLVPTTGSVNLTSEPDGAEIYLDLGSGFGDLVGYTNFLYEGLPPQPLGIYQYKFILAGYEEAQDTFEILAGETTLVHVHLTPL